MGCLERAGSYCIIPREPWSPAGLYAPEPALCADPAQTGFEAVTHNDPNLHLQRASAASLQQAACLWVENLDRLTRATPACGIQAFSAVMDQVTLQGVAFNPDDVTLNLHVVKNQKSFSEVWTSVGERGVLFNGGFFGEDQEPLGLLVYNGRQLSPAKDESPYSGLLSVDEQGRWDLRYLRTGTGGAIVIPKGLADDRVALQAGPMLVEPGRKPGIPRPFRDPLLARRTVLIKTRGPLWFVIVAEETDLYSLQNALLKTFPDLDTALALDGGPSSALAVEGLGPIMEIDSPLPVLLHLVPK